jgi:hypothetical protein
MQGYRNADIREYEVSTLPRSVQTRRTTTLLAREKEERVAQSKMEEECMLLCQGLTRPTVREKVKYTNGCTIQRWLLYVRKSNVFVRINTVAIDLDGMENSREPT